MTADYVYDALNAMTAIEENGATSGPGLLASLGYDGLGRLTGRTTAGGAGLSTSWAYGDNGLLASLTQTLAGGAGTTLGFTYSAARQILTRSDSNGAYTAQPPAQSSTYAANGLNQVVSATGTRGGPAAAAGLAYDPLGRISTDTENGSTTSFLYAGWSLVGEYSSSGAILARYVPGAGMDAPAAMYTGPGTANRAWYAADQRGSILATADASGAATLQLAYGPYGEPLTPAGASAWGESRYGYTGQIGVAGALAWFDKARMYDPAQGRFLQTDPLGLSAGTNIYAYAVQDPVNGADPWGLDSSANSGGAAPLQCEGDFCSAGNTVPPVTVYPIDDGVGDDYTSNSAALSVFSGGGGGAGPSSPAATTVSEVVVNPPSPNADPQAIPPTLVSGVTVTAKACSPYGGSSSVSFTGDATYYNLPGGRRAYGGTFSPNTMNAAMYRPGKIHNGNVVAVVMRQAPYRAVVVTVNDTGPFARGTDGRALSPLEPDPVTVIDLTPAAFKALTGSLKKGRVPVTVTRCGQ